MLKKSVLITGMILCLTTLGVLAEEKPNVLFIAIDDMNDWTTLFDKSHPIKTADYRYIRYHDGSEELYTHEDNWNVTNVAGRPDMEPVLKKHRRLMDEALGGEEQTADAAATAVNELVISADGGKATIEGLKAHRLKSIRK